MNRLDKIKLLTDIAKGTITLSELATEGPAPKWLDSEFPLLAKEATTGELVAKPVLLKRFYDGEIITCVFHYNGESVWLINDGVQKENDPGTWIYWGKNRVRL